ncbi:MAG: hypothetical protein KJO97_09145 [Acidimicrobiia bacterium]|nr:hypothetical protein [Acidimicrobiia bacterium]
MRRILVVFAALALVAAACGGGDDDGTGDAGGQSTQTSAGVADAGENGVSDDGAGDGSTDGGTDQSGGSGDGAPPDDDAAEIIGNPDLDLDALPDWVADELDMIDDMISIGECEAVGLRATAPENWVCRVFDEPVGGMDGFTMFTDSATTDLTISIATPTPIGAPCELMQACDEVEPIALSDKFPDTTLLDFMGAITIHGTHVSVDDAELVITKMSALTTDELELVQTVLDSVEPG